MGKNERPLTAEQQKMAEENIGLVGHILKTKICWSDAFSSIHTKDDLYQAGCEALCRAARNYDPGRGFAFSTYACNAIFKGMVRVLNDSERISAAEVKEDLTETATDGGIEDAITDTDLAEACRNMDMTDEQKRQIMVLYWRSIGLTFREIGDKLGVSKQQASNLNRKANKLIAEGVLKVS